MELAAVVRIYSFAGSTDNSTPTSFHSESPRTTVCERPEFIETLFGDNGMSQRKLLISQRTLARMSVPSGCTTEIGEGSEMWSSFTISSADSPAVVQDRFAAALTTTSPGWLSGPTTFRGEVWDTGFRVTRNLAKLERTLPIVATGQFTSVDGGTSVQVSTRPRVWVVLILCVWSTFWVQLLWRRLVSDPLPDGIHWGEIVVLFGFLVVGWCALFIGCTIEERQYQQAIAKIVSPDTPLPKSSREHILSTTGR